MSFDKVIFYNAFHNGDIHLSRTLVDRIIKTFPNFKYYYSHKNNKDLLLDVNNLESISFLPNLNNKNYKMFFINDNVLYFNTWYAAGNNKFFNNYGISFDSLYYVFDFNLKGSFGKSLNDIEDNVENLFPKINFNKFKTTNVDNYLKNYSDVKKVFISNGDVLSGQAVNFNYSSIINTLVSNHKDVLFIASNNHKDLLLGENLALSENIIDKKDFDLNENAYLSTKCDLIFGRSSGTYTFAMNQDNMFDSNKTMISFSNIGSDDNKYWLSDSMRDKVHYKAKVLNYNCGPGDILRIMNENIIRVKKEKLKWQIH